MSHSYQWYALQVNGRQELLVATQLRMKGYDEFVPVYEVRKRWADRMKRAMLPLFQGYVFCRMDIADRLAPVLTTPGVIRIIGAGRMPIPVDETEIESIRAAVGTGALVEPYPVIVAGQRVRIMEGALAGCEGVVLREKTGWRLVVSISLLQRSVSVEIESCCVEGVDKHDRRQWGSSFASPSV